MREESVTVPGLEPEITLRPPKRQNAAPSRHSLKCAICNHPDRAAIEFDFLNWRNPGDLVKSYRFRGLSTIYRHAHATGLLARRRLNLRFAMERIVERVNEVPVTATAVIRAARAITRINDAGQWVDPPSHLVIHRQDSSLVGAGLALPAPAQLANASRGTGSQPVDSSVEVSSEDRQATVGTEGFVGRAKRGLPGRRLVEPGGSVASGLSRGIPAHDSSETNLRPSLIFDDALLDEPSASASAELPRIEGKPAPPEIILELSPEFARCREERRRAIEADRQAHAAAAALIDQLPASGNGMPVSEGLVGRGFNRDINASSSSSSSLPQAAFDHPACSAPLVGALLACPDERRAAPATALEAKTSRGTGSQPVHDNSERRSASGLTANPETVSSPTPQEEQSVASSPSLLPQAAPENSAPSALTSSPSRSAGPPLGSSGSADPPFPFTPNVPLRKIGRRRF